MLGGVWGACCSGAYAHTVNIANVIYLAVGEPQGRDGVVHVEERDLGEEYLLCLRCTLCLEQGNARDYV